MSFGFGFMRRVFSQSTQEGTQTFLNNPDFNEFPAIQSPEHAAPTGLYGWIEITDDANDSIRIDVNNCPGRKMMKIEHNTGTPGNFSWQNTALLEGGHAYDVTIIAQSFGKIVNFDAYINGVAQNVGGSVNINHGVGDCTGVEVEWVEYNGVIDATGIGNFYFRVFSDLQVFDYAWLDEIRCDIN